MLRNGVGVMRGAVRYPSRLMSSYETILLEKKEGNIATITLNRPKALNALNASLIGELVQCLHSLDKDDDVNCTVTTGRNVGRSIGFLIPLVLVTGNDKAFVAGADIKMMQNLSFHDVWNEETFGQLDTIRAVKKPVIAAVGGYALGGGCELAMLCDIIVASDKAQFGQPEIKLGTIPGLGGTQRLTQAVGKAKAMDMCLTGDFIDAQEAKAFGLVSRVVPASELLSTAEGMARKIAGFSRPVVATCKEAMNQSFESTLQEGLHFERRLFHSTFATEDRKIGMDAFVAKQKPAWKNE